MAVRAEATPSTRVTKAAEGSALSPFAANSRMMAIGRPAAIIVEATPAALTAAEVTPTTQTPRRRETITHRMKPAAEITRVAKNIHAPPTTTSVIPESSPIVDHLASTSNLYAGIIN